MRRPVNCRDAEQWRDKNEWISPDREWLYDQYVTQEKSAYQIAHEVGADSSTVRKWLRECRIHMRSLREACELRSKDTEKRPPSGSRSPNWGGENVSEAAFRYRARQALKRAGAQKVCGWCGKSKERIQVNHRDHDFSNNDLSNLQYLCSRCHRLETILWNMYQEDLVDLNMVEGRIVLEEDELTIAFLKIGERLGDLT